MKRNWKNWLMTVIKRKKSVINLVGYTESIQVKNDAASWKYCAIGERREIIQSLGIECWSEPEDNVLSSLGLRFMEQIRDHKWTPALRTVNEIDRRLNILSFNPLEKGMYV